MIRTLGLDGDDTPWSVKSGVLPTLAPSTQASRISYHITWQHKVVATDQAQRAGYCALPTIAELVTK